VIFDYEWITRYFSGVNGDWLVEMSPVEIIWYRRKGSRTLRYGYCLFTADCFSGIE